MKKLLWVGDSPECPSGFGRATREILDRVRDTYEVSVLGINHRGDPPTVPYPVYTAAAGGDAFGVGRLIWTCERVQPDVIVIQQDGWYFPYYFARLRMRKEATGEYEFPDLAAIPVVGAVAIDGKNFKGEWIKDLTLAVFWTQFACDEARIGGYAGEARVIPLGVDLDIYRPVAREGAMERQRVSALKDKFVVGNVNRNQPRKRWDLTIRYFAEWVHSRGITDARLFLHMAPTGDSSVNVVDLIYYYGVQHMVLLYEPEVFYGKPEEDMRDTYCCFDVCVSTTQGEGMGLTTAEAMACGVPCIVPDWAALGDWAAGAAAMVPCPTVTMQSFHLLSSVIGGVPDQRAFVEALDLLYRDKAHRALIAQLGRARVEEPRFRWDAIGARWIDALDAVLSPKPAAEGEIWRDLGSLEAV